ncbi:MAG: mannose-1-phosphate guanyltransferase [Actinobacteria bacterium]|nr:MAG: mannose-1-phosphate guanyltransferase [Actinomycetota bacterium]
MKAVLMAGGEGTRLRPLTSNTPKPMVHLFNKPVMEYIIELLKQHDITDITATLQFLPSLIKNYYGDGSDIGVNISYAIEEKPLGTAGSVKNTQEYIDDTFIVISGDGITDFNLKKAIAFHKKNKALATLVLTRVENPLEYGVVITKDNGKIERFLEKPTWGQVFSDTVNTGIYILEPEVLKHIPENTSLDFSKDLFPELLKQGKPLYGYIAEGYWCDIGSFDQYLKVHQDVLARGLNINLDAMKARNNIWVGKDSFIHPSADISKGVFIGHHCYIEEGVRLGSGTVVGNNVVIKNGASVDRAIMQENAFIGSKASLVGCVIGKNCDIKAGARIEQGVIVGDDCVIGEDAIINYDVKIYPFKTVDAGATINRSIIWESKGMRSLFGSNGISGLANIDITPDLATRIAMAYGTSAGKGSFVVTSRDSNRVCRMVKRSMIAGLTSTGVHIRDLRVSPSAINRFNVATSRCTGGVHICVSPFDPQSIEIHFFDDKGINLPAGGQRNIEKYFYREDYRRAYYNEVGEIIFPARTSEFYTDGLLRHIDVEVIKEAKFKVIVDYAFGTASMSMHSVIGKLGIDALTLHAFTDETKTTTTNVALEHCLKELSESVKLFRANFGILFDNNCEKIYLIDDKGRRLKFNQLLHLMISLVCQYEQDKGKIAVPLSVSKVAEDISSKYARQLIRTKISASDLMEKSLDKNIVFAGAQGGGFIFPSFLPAYDASMTFCKLLEYLAYSKKPVSKHLSELPSYYLLEDESFCSWDNKGLVMRRLIEQSKDKDVQLIDGIKIFDKDGWVLVLPHPEDPVIRIIAESIDRKKAKQKISEYKKIIKDITESN